MRQTAYIDLRHLTLSLSLALSGGSLRGGDSPAFNKNGPVRLGRQGDELWEALDGVEEGQRVVIAGNVLIDAQAQLNQAVTPDTDQMTFRVPEANPSSPEGTLPQTRNSSDIGKTTPPGGAADQKGRPQWLNASSKR